MLAVVCATTPSTPVNALDPSLQRKAGQTLARAFHDDPLSTYLLPDGAKRARTLPWLYERVVRYGTMYEGEVLTVGDEAGIAVWLPPGQPSTPLHRLLRSGLALAPLKFGLESIPRFMAANTVEHLRAELAPEPHWYLWVIGVEPEQQGRGLGSALIEPMLQRADNEGVPCYLETHKERNVAFYQKHGYNVVRSGHVPRGGPAYLCLKREARR